MWTLSSSVQVFIKIVKKLSKESHNDCTVASFWATSVGFIGFCDSFQVIVNYIL